MEKAILKAAALVTAALALPMAQAHAPDHPRGQAYADMPADRLVPRQGAAMDPVVTRNTAEIMNQIRAMLQQTVNIMYQSRHLDVAHTHTLSQIMRRLSGELNAMSEGMESGSLDTDHITFLQQRLKRISNLIHSMDGQVGI